MNSTSGTVKLMQPTWTQRACSLFARYWEALQFWRQRRRLRGQLSALADRELHDMGLTRGEIDYLAGGGSFVRDPMDAAPVNHEGEER